MAALDVLPREVLAKCLEFLAFDQVVDESEYDVAYISIGDHERWTNHWQDRSKADAFKLAAAELLDRESNAGPGYPGPW